MNVMSASKKVTKVIGSDDLTFNVDGEGLEKIISVTSVSFLCCHSRLVTFAFPTRRKDSSFIISHSWRQMSRWQTCQLSCFWRLPTGATCFFS